MLNEALTALAGAAGTGLVTAMTTDAWTEVKTRFGKLLGRGDSEQEARQEIRLERSRQEVTSATADQVEQVRAAQEAAWRTRFADLLEEEPEREAQLRAALDFLGQKVPVAASGAVQVNAQAFGQAQQAVQGQGVQINTFGSPR
ncbi:hypothetical protein AB0395_23855 [Streptosporangium sp. NPDC051023]|uniref:hypothetical protein n=1 Tax=Streptosporangium sp. NPDC051023 TaxID=3155410 RepID=UPI00344BEA39